MFRARGMGKGVKPLVKPSRSVREGGVPVGREMRGKGYQRKRKGGCEKGSR